MKKIAYILVLILGLSACETEIDYNLDLPADKLVVSSFLEADSLINIAVNKSSKPGYLNYGNKEMGYVKDAKLSLYVNNNLQEISTKPYIDNIYSFNYIPSQGDWIEIRVERSGFDMLTGWADLSLTEPLFDSLDINLILDNEYGGDYYELCLYLELSSIGDGDEYYKIDGEIEIEYEEFGYGFKDNLILNDLELKWENIKGVYYSSESNVSIDDEDNSYRIFSNKLFKNNTYKARLSYPYYRLHFPEETKGIKIKSRIIVYKIEKQIYEYLYTLNKARNGGFMGTEPVIIKDGVENGYGFIGGRKAKVINIEKEIVK